MPVLTPSPSAETEFGYGLRLILDGLDRRPPSPELTARAASDERPGDAGWMYRWFSQRQSRHDDELAACVAGHEVAHRVRHVGEGVGFADDGHELAA